MKSAIVGCVICVLALATSGAAADSFDVRLVSQTTTTITLGWTPQPGYGYLFFADGQLVSRTNDPNRSTVRFSKSYSAYEVVVIARGAAGVYPPSTPPPPPPPPPEWTFCANEGGRCEFTGTKEVRYGAGSSFNAGAFADGVDCTNQVFGDPIVGTAKHCDYRDYTTPPPPPPGSLMGWQVTTQNVGLAPHGLSCSTLPAYTGPMPIPAGSTVTGRRITWSNGTLNLNAGGITIERSCMQPLPGAETTFAVVTSFTPSQPNRIIDSELDGSLISTTAIGKACGLRGIWSEITRTVVRNVGSGICLVDYTSSINYSVTYTNNWISDLRDYGDPAGSGSHNEAATTRCHRIDTNPSRRMTWRGNYIVTDVGNTSGGLFIQTTYGCPIGNLYVENNLIDGGYNFDIYADGSGYSGQFVSTNNRLVKLNGDFGYCAVQGFNWTEWSNNYSYAPGNADARGLLIGSC